MAVQAAAQSKHLNTLLSITWHIRCDVPKGNPLKIAK